MTTGKGALSQAQVKIAEGQIQDLAGRIGTSIMIWPTARKKMDALGIDGLDVQQALHCFSATGYEVIGVSVRYVGWGMDADDRYLAIKCAGHLEPMVIEVFAIDKI